MSSNIIVPMPQSHNIQILSPLPPMKQGEMKIGYIRLTGIPINRINMKSQNLKRKI